VYSILSDHFILFIISLATAGRYFICQALHLLSAMKANLGTFMKSKHVLIGSGPISLGAAYRLKELGETDFIVPEVANSNWGKQSLPMSISSKQVAKSLEALL
jgi:hypothetical protein